MHSRFHSGLFAGIQTAVFVGVKLLEHFGLASLPLGIIHTTGTTSAALSHLVAATMMATSARAGAACRAVSSAYTGGGGGSRTGAIDLSESHTGHYQNHGKGNNGPTKNFVHKTNSNMQDSTLLKTTFVEKKFNAPH